MKKLNFYIVCVMLMTSYQAFGKTNDTACTGVSVDVIYEQCKSGDTIITSSPAIYCDFNNTIVKTPDNRYYCVYLGKPRQKRKIDLSKFIKEGERTN